MSRYLGIYQNLAAVQSALNNSELSKPYVALYENNTNIDYDTQTVVNTYYNMPFTIKALGTGSITLFIGNWDINGGDGWYKLNDGNWTQITGNSNIQFNISTNDTIQIKGTGFTATHYTESASNAGDDGPAEIFNDSSIFFEVNCNYEVYGNILSLIYKDSFIGKENIQLESYTAMYHSNGYGQFEGLFHDINDEYGQNHYLISAENLILPSLILGANCYAGMFSWCINLTTAPELPATTLGVSCYNGMFDSCTSLTTAPALPATTLANGCYANMFSNCQNLITAPALPATTLAESCYGEMFFHCYDLTTAPELPATTLVYGCYHNMFYCCSSLNYIKCLATDISATYCTLEWVHGVANSGTFIKAANTDWSGKTGTNGIPSGWTTENAA